MHVSVCVCVYSVRVVEEKVVFGNEFNANVLDFWPWPPSMSILHLTASSEPTSWDHSFCLEYGVQKVLLRQTTLHVLHLQTFI